MNEEKQWVLYFKALSHSKSSNISIELWAKPMFNPLMDRPLTFIVQLWSKRWQIRSNSHTISMILMVLGRVKTVRHDSTPASIINNNNKNLRLISRIEKRVIIIWLHLYCDRNKLHFRSQIIIKAKVGKSHWRLSIAALYFRSISQLIPTSAD